MGDKARNKKPNRVIGTHPHLIDSEDDNLQNNTLENSVRLPLSANLPDFAVQISQHSSFERDQYIRYQSSLSTQGPISSLPPHRDSGLGESSPSSILISDKADQTGIVPDSQSLPGSSSYVPSTIASEVTSANHSARDIHSSRIADCSDLDSTNLRESEATQTGDAFSSSVASASEGFVVSSQRSSSAPPLLSSTVSRQLSSRRAAITQLARSVSDPRPVIRDSLGQVSLTRLLQIPTQGDDSSAGTKNFIKNIHHSYPSQNLETSSLELDFQTQVSLVLGSQTSQASTDLVGKYIYHSVQCLITATGNSNRSLRRKLAKRANHFEKHQISISDLI